MFRMMDRQEQDAVVLMIQAGWRVTVKVDKYSVVPNTEVEGYVISLGRPDSASMYDDVEDLPLTVLARMIRDHSTYLDFKQSDDLNAGKLAFCRCLLLSSWDGGDFDKDEKEILHRAALVERDRADLDPGKISITSEWSEGDVSAFIKRGRWPIGSWHLPEEETETDTDDTDADDTEEVGI